MKETSNLSSQTAGPPEKVNNFQFEINVFHVLFDYPPYFAHPPLPHPHSQSESVLSCQRQLVWEKEFTRKSNGSERGGQEQRLHESVLLGLAKAGTHCSKCVSIQTARSVAKAFGTKPFVIQIRS